MPIDIHALAYSGAQARIAELVAEIDALLETFPDLRKTPAGAASRPADAGAGRPKKGQRMLEATKVKLRAPWDRRKAAATNTETDQNIGDITPGPEATAKKRTLSAEARARISAVQKKRWEVRKKQAKKR
jgi:hypothetical protein